MSRLFECDYTIAEYRAHLGRLLGFFEPLESAASHEANAEGFGSVVRRSPNLREDLRIMGASVHEIDAIERCQRLPTFAPGGLSGYTYEVLGSTSGAKIIVRQLRAVLGPSASFRFYGDEDGLYQAAWSAFRTNLDRSAKTDIGPICATAAGIFDAYAAWLAAPLLGLEAADIADEEHGPIPDLDRRRLEFSSQSGKVNGDENAATPYPSTQRVDS